MKMLSIKKVSYNIKRLEQIPFLNWLFIFLESKKKKVCNCKPELLIIIQFGGNLTDNNKSIAIP